MFSITDKFKSIKPFPEENTRGSPSFYLQIIGEQVRLRHGKTIQWLNYISVIISMQNEMGWDKAISNV